jgi:hypothetical protein
MREYSAMSIDEGRRLWDEHMSAPFPSRLRGEEIDGVEMVLLDADIAGCVSTWLGNHGRLDEQRQGVLKSCLDDLARVLPLLDDVEEHAYYERLGVVGRLALG